MVKKGLVIALDGPSGAGKSTIARLLAQQLGYIYIDTGAMYRAIGWKAKQESINPADEPRLAELCLRTEVLIKNDDSGPRVYVDGRDVSNEIRTPEMGMMASSVSKSPAVRERLLVIQRELGKNGRVVMDGRDIGTVVFPDAEVKFFLDATAEERGRRRYLELKAKGMDVDLARITKEIQDRDKQDSGRALAPLRKADDAVLLDSTCMSIDDVLTTMLSAVKKVR